MLPVLMLPETEIRESGAGSVLDLGPSSERPDLLLVTLGITHSVEQESLDVIVQGSSDGANWLSKPVGAFSQKFYCGTYQILLDLGSHTDVRFLRPKWTVNRWGRGDLKPVFDIYLHAEPQFRSMAVGAA